MTGKLHEFDLAIRSEVHIHAAPEAVWRGMVLIGSWKSSIVTIEPLGGPAGGVGERVRVAQQAGDRVVHVVHRTVGLEPGRWRVQWMETEDRQSVRGYLAYTLHPQAEGTLLVGELLARAAVPVGSAPGTSDEEASRMILEATREKFHADHLVLKRLAESGRFG